MITYEKLFDLIREKGYSQNELMRKGIINARLFDALRKNKSITIDTLNSLCNNLNCTPNDIITYTKDIEE